MRAVAQDILPNNSRFNTHIDLCLSCRSCESVCPNNVNYGALVDTSRALFIEKKSLFSQLAKPFIRQRNLANSLFWLLWLAQKLQLDGLVKKLVPAAKLLPQIQKPIVWKSIYPATTAKKGAVSLFLVCASNCLLYTSRCV